MRSTLAGVFTADQASRGGKIYAGTCRSCHSGQTHSVSFKTNWSGRDLWKLYDYISHKMPRDDPGSLTHDDYTAVLAYLLRLNGMPVGATALPADQPTLKSIRFDTLSSRPDHVAR